MEEGSRRMVFGASGGGLLGREGQRLIGVGVGGLGGETSLPRGELEAHRFARLHAYLGISEDTTETEGKRRGGVRE